MFGRKAAHNTTLVGRACFDGTEYIQTVLDLSPVVVWCLAICRYFAFIWISTFQPNAQANLDGKLSMEVVDTPSCLPGFAPSRFCGIPEI